MNLIEQLGGYERASEDFKKLHLNLKEQQKSNKVFMDAFDALKTELLEYRRQHNIFEVGDKVVFKDVEKFKDNMLQVAHVELQKVLDIKSGLNGYTSFDEIRHAEPEELEAGKRLEVKSDS